MLVSISLRSGGISRLVRFQSAKVLPCVTTHETHDMAGDPKKLKEKDGYYSVGYTPSKQSKSSDEKFVLWPAPARPEGIYARLSGVRFSSTAEYLARMDELEDEFRSKHEAAQALVHPDERKPWVPLMDRKFDKHSSHSPSEDDIQNATMFDFLQETSG